MKAIRVLLVLVVLCASLSSCVRLKGAGWSATGFGTDFEDLDISAERAKAKVINNSKAFKYGCDLAKKLWDAYMMYMGFKFVSGLYYDHLGNQLSSETSIQLETLRNAHTEKMALQEFEKLRFMHGAVPTP